MRRSSSVKGGGSDMTKKAAGSGLDLVTTFVAILVAITFLTGVAFAATTAITGDVISTDHSAQTLMVDVQGQGMTFSVAEEMGQVLGKLKPGDKVTVGYSYTDADGKLTAQSITKLPVGG